ncbi:MAG: holo-ACP synthase [Phycisphaerales bacterium]|nr:holo-ACP synthase [Phycisphaerales bacterium]
MPIIGHGVDIVEIARIKGMLADHGERFAERCFTSEERTYADESERVRPERYAARFAAKEAVLKALGTGLRYGLAFTDIEVRRTGEGGPEVQLHGVAEDMAQRRGITAWQLSLSHAGGFAIASVIAEG